MSPPQSVLTPPPVRAITSSRPAHLLPTEALWPRRTSPAAREELVRRHLPLARRLAARYRGSQTATEDLEQAASLGLIGAIDRFDPDRGLPFPAFAIPTILGELKHHFRQTGWALHVPRGAQEMALRVERAIGELGSRGGRSPQLDEIAAHLGVGLDEVLRGLEASQSHHAISLDAPVGAAEPDGDLVLVDTIGSEDEGLGLVDARLSLRAAIGQLPYLERRALALRMERNLKQSEIAAVLGCSQMQISRVLRRASARIRGLTGDPLPPG